MEFGTGIKMTNNILIIGDPIIDEHTWANTKRISPEAPVPVCNFVRSEVILGGAANVAKQVNVFANAYLTKINAIDDSVAEEAILAEEINIVRLPTTKTYVTPVKNRIWSNGQQVCRLDNEIEDPLFDMEDYNLWISLVKKSIIGNDIKLVIFSDYDKGLLCDYMIEDIALYCKSLGVITILDPKRPTYYRIKGLTIVKPNLKEAKETGLSFQEISAKMTDTCVMVTQGANGMSLYFNEDNLFNVGGVTVDVADPCGCGDTAVSVLGYALSNLSGLSGITTAILTKALRMANFAASRAAQHHGNYILSNVELLNVEGMA